MNFKLNKLKTVNQIIQKLDIGLVVLSSQAYKELWPIFFESWNKYFFKINIKKYIISSNENSYNKKYDYRVVSGNNTTPNTPWSLRIKRGLKKIKHKNLFFTTEDMIFNQYGDEKLIKECFEFYYNKSALYLRTSPKPPLLSNNFKNKFARDPDWALHQVSLQPALINKKFLIKNLNDNDNSRIFEEKASYYNRKNKNIYASRYEVFPYEEIVIGGKLIRSSIKNFKKLNLILPKKINKMPILTHLNYIFIKKFKFWLLYKLPVNVIKFLIINEFVGYKKKY